MTQMNEDHVAKVLNDLIDVCKDGEDGYRQAMEGVNAPGLRSLFSKYSMQRGEFARELQNEVSKLGEKPETKGTARAALHRGWINIKSVVTGKDEKAIIDECETGDDVAKDTYERAIKDSDLPTRIQSLIQRQYDQVKVAHDSIRSLQLQHERSR